MAPNPRKLVDPLPLEGRGTEKPVIISTLIPSVIDVKLEMDFPKLGGDEEKEEKKEETSCPPRRRDTWNTSRPSPRLMDQVVMSIRPRT